MRSALILMMAALPAAATDWDDDHRWKLDEKETIRRSFDAASGSGGRKLLVDNIHGYVHVTGTSGSQVQVTIEKHIYADSSEAMHCFTGDAAQARQALDLGFHLSFGGVLTFPKAEGLREAAKITPEDRLLVETDCPYLAPVPYRGTRNEPAFVVETARRLAQVRGVTPEAIAACTTRNFRALCLRGQTGNS